MAHVWTAFPLFPLPFSYLQHSRILFKIYLIFPFSVCLSITSSIIIVSLSCMLHHRQLSRKSFSFSFSYFIPRDFFSGENEFLTLQGISQKIGFLGRFSVNRWEGDCKWRQSFWRFGREKLMRKLFSFVKLSKINFQIVCFISHFVSCHKAKVEPDDFLLLRLRGRYKLRKRNGKWTVTWTGNLRSCSRLISNRHEAIKSYWCRQGFQTKPSNLQFKFSNLSLKFKIQLSVRLHNINLDNLNHLLNLKLLTFLLKSNNLIQLTPPPPLAI